jgi:hypothetical protein
MRLLASQAIAGAQPSRPALRLDSLFVAHRHALRFDEGRASGPGFDLLVDAATRAQFVVIGESHNVREIPLFTLALFERLHAAAGYRYLGMEDGPHAIAMLVAPGVRGEVARASEVSRRYVNALQFRTDQELQLIAGAGRVSRGGGQPVWGLDNELGTLHLLDALVPLAPDAAASALARRLADSARVYERVRPDDSHPRFINRVLRREDVHALDSAFRRASPGARRLVDGLVEAFEIYAVRREGPTGVYAGNVRRERLMRSQFMRHYAEAQRAGDSLPRVILKFGQWHALRGILNWGNVEPLGTFLGELARANASESVHVWTGLLNRPGAFWSLDEARFADFHPIAAAGSADAWWLVDLRPIRPFVAQGLVADVNEEMRKLVFGFDLALLIGGGSPATTALLGEGARSTR